MDHCIVGRIDDELCHALLQADGALHESKPRFNPALQFARSG